MPTTVLKPTSEWQHLKWYEYLPNRDRLELWVRSQAPGRISSLRFDLKDETSGWFDPNTRAIGVNPTSVGKTVREQWIGTRAIARHEAGHANYTGNLGSGLLHHVANILEDQRIEWLATNGDSGAIREMRFKNRWRWKTTTIATAADDNPERILDTLLIHRWEWWLGLAKPKRTKKGGALSKGASSKIVLCSENQERWKTVRPWVEEAWRAQSSDDVVAYARHILEFLKIPETLDLPDFLMLILKTDGLSAGTGTPILATPRPPKSGSGFKGDKPDGDGNDDESPSGEDDPIGHDAGADQAIPSDLLNPNYAEWVDQVAPWVVQLSARLERHTPRVRIVPNDRRGRYSLRADLHDPDRPFLARTAPAVASGLAVDILGDRSGSMGSAEPTDDEPPEPKMVAARLGVMTIHLACEARRIPHAVTLFDGFVSVLEYGGDAQIASALIAGWNGETGSEHVSDHMRKRAPKLLARSEGTKLMIVVHDGYPVASGDPEDIVLFQKEYAGRIHVVGVYLCGESDGRDSEISRMRELFARLVVAKPSELPNKLGDLIAALA